MPIPEPNKNESEKDFISRCMENDVMKQDFPNNKQRIAVCYSSWRDDKKIKKPKDLCEQLYELCTQQ